MCSSQPGKLPSPLSPARADAPHSQGLCLSPGRHLLARGWWQMNCARCDGQGDMVTGYTGDGPYDYEIATCEDCGGSGRTDLVRCELCHRDMLPADVMREGEVAQGWVCRDNDPCVQAALRSARRHSAAALRILDPELADWRWGAA
jgi:hypothetical protein